MKFNKKLIIMLCSVIAVILIIIVAMMLFVGGKSKVLSFSKIEEKVMNAGINYYDDNKDKLVNEGTATVSVSTLVGEGYLNDLSKYTEDGVTCSGYVYATKNPVDYSYRVNLDCGENYKTLKFSDVILRDSLSSQGNGLYTESQLSSDGSGEYNTVHVFKGDNVHNYIKMGDFYWRIVKVFENGEVAVLGDPELLRSTWDNRYNIELENYRGINDYLVSRLKDTIQTEVIDVEDGYLIIKSLITKHNACVGKRLTTDTSKDGSTECSTVVNNQYFSLLPIYDYINASLDSNCNKVDDNSCYNYNYLSSENDEWWTITGVADSSQDVYYIDNTVEYEYANHVKNVRLYAHLDSNVTYVSGTGTYEDPYILK